MDAPARLTDHALFDLEVRRTEAGGFGVVHMGPDHRANGEWRALKTFRPGAARDAFFLFVREALTWYGFWPHPNLLPALAVRVIDRRPYILLPYAEKGNLRAQLRHPHRLSTRLSWAQMIACGLVALHTPDPDHLRPWPTVHRDLKPENVLLDGRRVARITDFGLARAFEIDGAGTAIGAADAAQTEWASRLPAHSRQLQSLGAPVVGTPAYMAPEQ